MKTNSKQTKSNKGFFIYFILLIVILILVLVIRFILFPPEDSNVDSNREVQQGDQNLAENQEQVNQEVRELEELNLSPEEMTGGERRLLFQKERNAKAERDGVGSSP